MPLLLLLLLLGTDEDDGAVGKGIHADATRRVEVKTKRVVRMCDDACCCGLGFGLLLGSSTMAMAGADMMCVCAGWLASWLVFPSQCCCIYLSTQGETMRPVVRM